MFNGVLGIGFVYNESIYCLVNLAYFTLQFRILHKSLYSKLNPKLSLSWIGTAGRAQISNPEVPGSSPCRVLFLPGGNYTMACLGVTYKLLVYANLSKVPL